MREEIEKEGGLKLIYIDPPFAVGADFGFNIEIGGETAEKKQSIIEEIAYRDTWGKGISSYLSMMYERLKLMHNLLAEDGTIYLHCDWRVNSHIRLILDDLFGQNYFINEIIWQRGNPRGNTSNRYSISTDTILIYSKSDDPYFDVQYTEHKEGYLENYYNQIDEVTGELFQPTSLLGHSGINPIFNWREHTKPWRYPAHRLDELDKAGKIYWPPSGKGVPRYKKLISETKGRGLSSLFGMILM
jgi:adenine specific DNA methylase Mod